MPAADHLARIAAILHGARRINVVGTSGTGKSTFSRMLSAVKEIPHHEMDRLYWLPGWKGRSDGDFLEKVGDVTAGESWVLDGNYNRSRPVKWARVECVVWLDYSFGRTFFQAVSRAVRRAIAKDELWPGTGNRESFRQSFFSRDSVLLWTLKTYRSNRARYREMMDDAAARDFEFVRITSPAEAAEVLELIRRGAGR